MTLDIIITIFQGVYIAGLLIIGLFAKKYLPSYLQQKGRNLATKEDISEITDKIESVRIQYNEIIQKLIANLSFKNEQELRIFDKRNEALLKFLEDCHILTTEKLSLDLRYLVSKQLQIALNNQTFTENILIKIFSDLIDYQSSIMRLFPKVSLSGSRVYLFYPYDNPSDEVIKSTNKLLSSIKSFQNIFSEKFSNLNESLVKIASPSITNESHLLTKINTINTLVSDYAKEIQPNIIDISAAIVQYVLALNNYFNKLGYKQLSDQLSQK